MRVLFFLSGLLMIASCETTKINDTGKKEDQLQISGIYPHLAMYNQRPGDRGVGETGVGAVVPWADRLWVMTYSASHPFGGADKLYEIDSALNVTIRPESKGGTHANRMIHRESEQLIMGPYFIDKSRNVRSVPSSEMSGRLTGVVRHLTDPVNKVYFYAMEEGFYEVDVNSLNVKTLYEDGFVRNPSNPQTLQVLDREHISGTHGKGAYTSQGRVIVSNNGIRYWTNAEPGGTTGGLGAWDGQAWEDVDTRQFVEVTGPGGIYGNEKDTDPIWATGWDFRSVILKVLEDGRWHDYRLPKASFTYDGLHGHFTEWPRIREIDNKRKLMTMHGMFWNFPETFTTKNSAGIEPLSSYLKIVTDYTWWNGNLVLGCDDASMFDNPLVGRPQSNLWFIQPQQLNEFGPRNGFGGVWINDNVSRNEPSDPFLVNGFDHKVLHLAHGSNTAVTFTIEIDAKGNGDWKEYNKVLVPPSEYVYYGFPSDVSATWVRLKPDVPGKEIIAYFSLSQKERRAAEQSSEVFESLPSIGSDRSLTYGLIRPGASDEVNLQYVAFEEKEGQVKELGYYEVDRAMNMVKVENDTITQWLKDKIGIRNADFSVDDASVIVKDHEGKVFRLPKNSEAYDSRVAENMLRGIREVVTERSLFNCHGTFYELPRSTAGGIARIKPIATHNREIYDFCSWRGMMVIAGNFSDAVNNGNYFRSEDGKTGLWFGTIDDLWRFGKPVGQGGPWLNTSVVANVHSDPYLMTGYDHKEMKLSHQADAPVKFTVEVDLTARGDWQTFDTFVVQPGETLGYIFPDGYNAHWVRLKADRNCTASAQFDYK